MITYFITKDNRTINRALKLNGLFLLFESSPEQARNNQPSRQVKVGILLLQSYRERKLGPRQGASEPYLCHPRCKLPQGI